MSEAPMGGDDGSGSQGGAGSGARPAARLVRSFLSFWYDFLIGDDWTVALGVAIALAVTYGVSRLVPAWWVLPIAVVALLGVSLRRLAGRS